jgi:hypothetical protein
MAQASIDPEYFCSAPLTGRLVHAKTQRPGHFFDRAIGDE